MALPPTPYKPTPFGAFTGVAPTATPYAAFTGTPPAPAPTGAFVAPTPGTMSQAGQFRLSQGLKAIERGAAARGTLLTGALQARLNDYAGDSASQEYDNDYRRALSTYTTNRDTDATNFGRSLTGFQGSLASYGANRETAAQNVSQGRASYQDALAGYATNRETAAMNANNERAAFPQAVSAPTLQPPDTSEADKYAMLERRQYADARDRLADERRAAATLADDNALLERRQYAATLDRTSDERRAAASLADDNALLERQQYATSVDRTSAERRAAATLADDGALLQQRQFTGNQARLADEARATDARLTPPPPTAAGYPDMLAQYAEYQRQVEAEYQRQLANSRGFNEVANRPGGVGDVQAGMPTLPIRGSVIPRRLTPGAAR